MYADLHIYTNYSHGTNSPREILNLAKKAGINVISITDHDCVDGVREARDHLKDFNIRVISGVELSTMYEGKYVNVLGYYIDVDSRELDDFFKSASDNTTQKTYINFELAKNQGVFDYSWDRVLELHQNEERISGVHVIYAMNKDGYKVPGTQSNWEIFKKYFSTFPVGYVFPDQRTPFDAIDVIKKSGGVPVLAHPKLVGDDRYVRKFLDYGAEGIEVYHSIHTPEDNRKYLKMAEENGVYITGGTGWRGENNHEQVHKFGMHGLKHGAYGILRHKNGI